MEMSFSGKTALVTGAGKGIGRDLAVALVKCGAKTLALSRTESDLKSLNKECPGVETVLCDLGDWDKTRETISQLGPIDLLVNNAAVGQLCSFLDATPEEFNSIFTINLKQVVNVSQVVARTMIERGKGGSIVNVSSQSSKAALENHCFYCASKGALDSLSGVMALELGKHNIRVNTVNPTVIMTAMAKVGGWSDPDKASKMVSRIPLGRFGEVNEVVDCILFLLSDRSSMVSGVNLPIDGGFLAC